MKLITFASLSFKYKRKKLKRTFFAIEKIAPWKPLINKVRRHYVKGQAGRSPMPLEGMLRINLMRQWFALSDPAWNAMLWLLFAFNQQ